MGLSEGLLIARPTRDVSYRPRFRRAMKILGALVALHLAVAIAGWSTRARWLPSAIARAPNAGKSVTALEHGAVPADARLLRVDVGPPAASLSMWIVEARESTPRGTIFVLHGIRDSKRSMLGVGRSLAASGYRAVLVDLRGHGESTGDWLSFGAREGRDLRQALDAHDRDGVLARPVGVYGPSYGGAAALQLAACDERVRAVVAVATFTRMKDVVPLYVERVVPSWFVSRVDTAAAIDRAGVLGEFTPGDADSLRAIAATRAEVLLIHGRDDTNIPWQASAALHDAAPDHSRVVIVDGHDHGSIMSDPVTSRESAAWFARWLVPPPPDARAAPSQQW